MFEINHGSHFTHNLMQILVIMGMDLVAHCGRHLSGAFLRTLFLADIASGWKECVALPARDAELIIRAADRIQKSLPFLFLGPNVDNGAEFINEAFFEYCIYLAGAFSSTQEAWIEQNKGSVVRKLSRDGRLTENQSSR
jgi:hypothetical protein